MIPDERVIELAKEAAPKQSCEHGYACFDIEELQRFAALIQDEPTDKESLTVEPVGYFEYGASREWYESSSENAVPLFIHPAEDAKDALLRELKDELIWCESHWGSDYKKLTDKIDKVIQEGE